MKIEEDLAITGTKVIPGKQKVHQNWLSSPVGDILTIMWRLQNKRYLLENRWMCGGYGHLRVYDMGTSVSGPEIEVAIRDSIKVFSTSLADEIAEKLDFNSDFIKKQGR